MGCTGVIDVLLQELPVLLVQGSSICLLLLGETHSRKQLLPAGRRYAVISDKKLHCGTLKSTLHWQHEETWLQQAAVRPWQERDVLS
jgi:hypothetical protein